MHRHYSTWKLQHAARHYNALIPIEGGRLGTDAWNSRFRQDLTFMIGILAELFCRILVELITVLSTATNSKHVRSEIVMDTVRSKDSNGKAMEIKEIKNLPESSAPVISLQ